MFCWRIILNRTAVKQLVPLVLALAIVFSSSAFAQIVQHEPFARKLKPPAFMVSPATDTYQPGAEITLTSTAKKKMPKGLTFFLGNQVLAPTPVNALAVRVTVPAAISDGTYTLIVATGNVRARFSSPRGSPLRHLSRSPLTARSLSVQLVMATGRSIP